MDKCILNTCSKSHFPNYELIFNSHIFSGCCGLLEIKLPLLNSKDHAHSQPWSYRIRTTSCKVLYPEELLESSHIFPFSPTQQTDAMPRWHSHTEQVNHYHFCLWQLNPHYISCFPAGGQKWKTPMFIFLCHIIKCSDCQCRIISMRKASCWALRQPIC